MQRFAIAYSLFLLFAAGCTQSSLFFGRAGGDVAVTSDESSAPRAPSREHVAKSFAMVFGGSPLATDADLFPNVSAPALTSRPRPIHEYLLHGYTAFGGSCNFYESSPLPAPGVTNSALSDGTHTRSPDLEGCFFSPTASSFGTAAVHSGSQAPLFSRASPVSFGQLRMACRAVLLNVTQTRELDGSGNVLRTDIPLNHAIRQAYGLANASAADAKLGARPALDDMDELVDLFSPGREWGEEFLTGLWNIGEVAAGRAANPDTGQLLASPGAEAVANRTAWRMMVLTLCESGLLLLPL